MQPGEEDVNLPPQLNERMHDAGKMPEDEGRNEEAKKAQLQLDEEDLKEIKLTSGEIEEVLKVQSGEDATKGSSGPEEKDITD